MIGSVTAESGPSGATPLEPDEIEGLIPDLQTTSELNEWEHANILKAYPWAFSRAGLKVLDMQFVLELHRKMLDETWQWAGKLRWSDKNIGVHWPTIPESLDQVLNNARYWIEHNAYTLDEIAVRFHHQLVRVHPFPNGNGRHARLMADILLAHRSAPPLTWGSRKRSTHGTARELYLGALREADRGNVEALLKLARR
ncbi:MAG: mobile mystery protein B [Mycobacterium sp.]